MGLIGEVLLLPFAPVRGSLWAVGQVLAEAERQYYDPAAIQAELAPAPPPRAAGVFDERLLVTAVVHHRPAPAKIQP
ncbi:gas vesicle protein GvpG, partial [Streptomyces sp. NPDC058255]|uniref:gas vesicle protein GvpG n=1 Tax=Streptomyces sp. NPDC058255 TaxID=3346407 RepID=UPI0036E38F8D